MSLLHQPPVLKKKLYCGRKAFPVMVMPAPSSVSTSYSTQSTQKPPDDESSFNEKDLLMKIIRKQNIQNGLLSSINERLASLEDSFKNFTPSVTCSVQEDSETIFEMFDLPLDSEDHLKNFEEFLSTSTAFSKVVNEVSRLGGNSHYDDQSACHKIWPSHLQRNFS
nr:unnamed protein product [Callosobruchus analis]